MTIRAFACLLERNWGSDIIFCYSNNTLTIIAVISWCFNSETVSGCFHIKELRIFHGPFGAIGFNLNGFMPTTLLKFEYWYWWLNKGSNSILGQFHLSKQISTLDGYCPLSNTPRGIGIKWQFEVFVMFIHSNPIWLMINKPNISIKVYRDIGLTATFRSDDAVRFYTQIGSSVHHVTI